MLDSTSGPPTSSISSPLFQCNRNATISVNGVHDSSREVETRRSQATESKSNQNATKRQIKYFSSQLVEDVVGKRNAEKQLSIDQKRLKRALQDTGQYAIGIAAVEVWVLSEETGHLVRPGGHASWWSDPDIAASDALYRLSDPTHPSYETPSTVMPGVDVPGVLFAESSQNNEFVEPWRPMAALFLSEFSPQGAKTCDKHLSFRSTPETRTAKCASSRSIAGHSGSIAADDENAKVQPKVPFHRKFGSTRGQSDLTSDSKSATKGNKGRSIVHFRDLNSLLQDPDTPNTSRLSLLLDAGFSHAAGILFQSRGVEGIVLCYTRREAKPTEMGSRTICSVNMEYLRRSTELIGSVIASIEARRAVVAMKLCVAHSVTAFTSPESEKDKNAPSSCCGNGKCPLKGIETPKVWWRKCRGGDLQIPPSLSWYECGWTLLGCFTSLMILAGFNDLIRQCSADKYYIITAPIGSLMALHDGMPFAPASQPRNIVWGQAVAGAIGLLFSYIRTISQPLREAIATTCAVVIMAKMGVIHAPAGATAIIFSSGSFDWTFYGLLMLCNAILIVPAVVINNLNKKRQYPTYWGYVVNLFRRKQ